MNVLRALITETNKYLGAAGERPVTYVLQAVADYATSILRVFGLIDPLPPVGFSVGGAAASLETLLAPYLDTLAAFRETGACSVPCSATARAVHHIYGVSYARTPHTPASLSLLVQCATRRGPRTPPACCVRQTSCGTTSSRCWASYLKTLHPPRAAVAGVVAAAALVVMALPLLQRPLLLAVPAALVRQTRCRLAVAPGQQHGSCAPWRS